MARQGRQDRQRIEIRDPFDCLVAAKQKTIDVRPLDPVLADAGMQSKLDEHQVAITAPLIDISPQVGKDIPEALELTLRGLDPDHARCERLHQHHVGVKKIRQPLR